MVDAENKLFGVVAERFALQWLQKQGYQILEKNVRFRQGELDLVVREGNVLVFCEIKARRRVGTGEPGEAIDRRKQNKMVRLATDYLQSHPDLVNLECRFDAILLKQSGIGWQVEHIQDAFRPGWE